MRKELHVRILTFNGVLSLQIEDGVYNIEGIS
jgi:hypothetical protein